MPDFVQYYQFVDSPIGKLRLMQSGDALCGLIRTEEIPEGPCEEKETELFIEVKKQLKEYFLGERKTFTVPMVLEGTAFQKKVWKTLQTIPYGEVISYGEEAKRMDCRCARAVGSANGRNPICILIPCHRVIRSDGGIGGYTGGLDMKEFLLDLEQHYQKK